MSSSTSYGWTVLLQFISAARLAGVIVKASDNRPPVKNVQELDERDFLFCGSRTTTNTPAERIKITCKSGADGRYVYVYLAGTNYLTLCEVEIYGDGKSDVIEPGYILRLVYACSLHCKA